MPGSSTKTWTVSPSAALEPPVKVAPRTREEPRRFVEPGQEEPIVVLVIEDDPGHRALIALAFEDCMEPVDVRFVESADEAADYLFRAGRYECANEAPRPDIILLDLSVPGLDGEELLLEIHDDPALRRIPVVVFAAADSEIDLARSYEFGASSFFTKPDTLDGYREVVRALQTHWLRRVRLPRKIC